MQSKKKETAAAAPTTKSMVGFATTKSTGQSKF
jgi:hypothetical protein